MISSANLVSRQACVARDAADPIGALALLQLGRAYVMSRNRANAKSAYEEFLKLWTDADPEIPILRQAKSEYAKV